MRFLPLQAVASTFSGSSVRVAQPSGRTTRRSVVVRAEGSELAQVIILRARETRRKRTASDGAGLQAAAVQAQPFHGARGGARLCPCGGDIGWLLGSRVHLTPATG